MKHKFLLPVIAALALTTCMRSANDQLIWRWSFSAVRLTNQQAFLDSISRGTEDEDVFNRYFLDYKLILRKNNTFDLSIFRRYLHGQWEYNELAKSLLLRADKPDGITLQMQVDSLTPGTMQLKCTQAVVNQLIPATETSNRGMSFFKNNSPYIFTLTADELKYDNEASDPYSRENNLWRIKPVKPETDAEIKQRVLRHIKYLRLLMLDVVNGKKTYISLHSFHTPLIIDKDDIRLQHIEDIRPDWGAFFYDSTQAQKGYDYLVKAVIENGVNPGDSNDRFINSVSMLEQALNHLENIH